MKNIVWLLAATALLVGCDSRQTASNTPVSAIHAPKEYVRQGFNYLKEAKPREAIKSFDAAIRQNPRDPGPYLILGQTYLRINRFDRAIDTFSAATRVSPADGHLYYLLAVSYERSGNVKDAKLNAEKSFGLFRRDKDADGLKKSLALLKSFPAAK